jgi:hypothetical protein
MKQRKRRALFDAEDIDLRVTLGVTLFNWLQLLGLGL